MAAERTGAGWALLRRHAAEYGMVLVLLLISGLFTVLTWGTHYRTDEAAVAEVSTALRASKHVLVAVQSQSEDVLFADALVQSLSDSAVKLTVVKGEPVAARDTLVRLRDANTTLDAIVLTEATSKWLLWLDLHEDFPTLGEPKIVLPPRYSGSLFLTTRNLLNIANQIAVIAIVAIGMTLVIITGGIDLSVGSLIALSAVVTTLLIREYGGGVKAETMGILLGCAGGILVCGAAGLFSGFMITRFGIPPFIATLSMMLMMNGLAYLLADHQTIDKVPESFVWLGRGADLGLPNAVVLMLLLYVAAHGMMSQMRLGRHVYAVGGNVEAALLSGIPIGKVLLIAYTLCGLAAGVGGVVTASLLKSGSATYGQAYEMYVIAAVVVGGTSLSGGRGKMFGTLIGAFIIAVIQNGMNLTRIDSDMQRIVLGAVILGAVLLDRLRQRAP